MNVHLSAHFPLIQIVVAALGLLILVFLMDKKSWAVELGKALLWAGAFAALFSAAGSC